ncbi:gliding motility-associated C-terminal domain-containing protein [Mucilaginibacter ginkgonis]|uniref:Gliding motility-associated C-terminal domain-containing protein n=1 Tax=Mucilaginibacter ginkgonis TaxID=2682091 RepID=A0A6I4HX06_9SPHI|nr:gliding motility-associated C-terminal domain-containing protein [Mucilaginibacter ginkgonis]QQL51369.1 gliding motility-associated C-terminal domain-containing protein [Mucilaginibacter ginkgonis]
MKLKLLRNCIFIIVFIAAAAVPRISFAQGCPVNVDFENGDFNQWTCYRGVTSSSGQTNYISVNQSSPTNGVHTIIPKGTQLDPYGKFPITPPDGSKYAVRLGNDGTGAQAERLSYNFTVPQTDFALTYQYAVVLQDPNHSAEQQPRFTAKVLDLTTNTYISCSSFNYVATANIPGFKKSTVSNMVIYKGWTPVTIDLSAFKGRQMQLEFTTADCTQGGHFGYAYIDVNRTCSSIINGNNYCANTTDVPLLGPAGYATYQWYNEDRSTLLGTTNPLIIKPVDGQKVILDLTPYDGFGCAATLTTTLHKSSLAMTVTDPPAVCYPATVDVTKAVKVTDDLAVINVFTDAACTNPVDDPKAIATSGTYYIQAYNLTCGSLTQSVNVTVNPKPNLKVTNPPTACSYETVDLSAAAIVAGSDAGLTYTFFADANATVPLTDYSKVKAAGTYYIVGTNKYGCSTIQAVNITFYPPIDLVVQDPGAVCFPSTVDITTPGIANNTSTGGVLSYWKDVNATVPLVDPTKIIDSGVYYIKLIDPNACQVIKPVNVTVHSLPTLKITAPKDVCLPGNVDITQAYITKGSKDINKLSYWRDAKATIALNNPTSVTDSGKYYIKATSVFGCETVDSVLVGIHKLPVLKITAPAGVYQPQTINLAAPAVTAGSSPRLYFSYYLDSTLTIRVPNQYKVSATGTYYIKAENVYGCDTSAAVKIIVAEVPDIKVPKAFTPGQTTNDRLYPFLIGIKLLKVFKVYNRWGNLVFQTSNAAPGAGWDGNTNGKINFMDTYSWVAEGYDQLGNLVHRTGNTLILK